MKLKVKGTPENPVKGCRRCKAKGGSSYSVPNLSGKRMEQMIFYILYCGILQILFYGAIGIFINSYFYF